MSFKPEKFYGIVKDLPAEFLARLDRQFAKVSSDMEFTYPVVRNFVSAATGAVTENLPAGSRVQYDYFFIKTDSSANAVTIQANGTELINGSATYVLAAQYNRVLLSWYAGSWYVISA